MNEAFSIQTIHHNLFLISFESMEDKHKVLLGRSWLFDVALFSIKDFYDFTPPAKMFGHETFWIQMNHLPLAYLNIGIGDQIGRTIERMIECAVKDYGGSGGRIIHVCVEVDLFKSICRGRIINVMGNRLWIPFTYEKRPWLCFKCGQILHGNEGCEPYDSATTTQYEK